METILETIHGSRLYGLHHQGSDYDYYRVVDKVPTKKRGYAKQTIDGDRDVFVVDLSTWMEMLHKGVPQAWEAAFSRMATLDKLAAWRGSLKVGTAAWPTYWRTIKSFSDGNYKQRRHAIRLAINLRGIMDTGRFNPTLTKHQVSGISACAHDETLGYCEGTLEGNITWQ